MPTHMRKHFFGILLPIVVAISAYFIYVTVNSFNPEGIEKVSCKSSSKQECLLENRRREFTQKWEMSSWSKNNLF